MLQCFFMSKEIILNKMYAGDYLSMGNNIGHEAINLYRADNGKFYIYLNSMGKIDWKEHDKKEKTVLLVRKFANRTFEIIAKAENVKLHPLGNNRWTDEDRKKFLADENNRITYNGVPLEEIFRKNFYNNFLEDKYLTLVTFEVEAENFYKPVNSLYITDQEDIQKRVVDGAYFVRTPKGFGSQSLREFFKDDDTEVPKDAKFSRSQSFEDLNEIVNTADLWRHPDDDESRIPTENPQANADFNFFRLIARENTEVAFSNLLYGFLDRDRELLKEFARRVLKIPDLDPNATIERETRHIDITIRDARYFVIIENKIRSGINGSLKILENGKIESQLSDYWKKAMGEVEKGEAKIVKGFVFAPDYNQVDLTRYQDGEHYDPVRYSELYKFFKEYFEQGNSSYRRHVDEYRRRNERILTAPYAPDLLSALGQHSGDRDNSLEQEMRQKFWEAIQRADKD